MPEVISELIVTLDMKARGERSPGYYGYTGAELDAYFVRKLKQGNGLELRILGSLSMIRQLAAATLLDVLRLTVCPLVLPVSGFEPVFGGWDDTGLELTSHRLIDKRVLVLEYRPSGKPPMGDDNAKA